METKKIIRKEKQKIRQKFLRFLTKKICLKFVTSSPMVKVSIWM